MLHAEVILQRLADVGQEGKLARLQPQIIACRRLLAARHGLDVAVFGRFKAGESSFLNHLIGRAVLPIGVVPLTAVLTRLRYGPSERAVVRFLDGRTREIPLPDIALYVSASPNPANRKQVAAVEVELPALRPLAPPALADTPGPDSALLHNTEAALNRLPPVGVVLLAIGSDAPFSARDLALLGQLRRHTRRLVVLLTEADLLTERQRAGVRAFVAEQLDRAGYPPAGVLPLRAPGIGRHENDLAHGSAPPPATAPPGGRGPDSTPQTRLPARPTARAFAGRPGGRDSDRIGARPLARTTRRGRTPV